MSFLKKSISLLAFFAVVPVAYAVTARPSVTNAAATTSRRLPTLTAYVNSGTTTSAGDTGSSSTMSDTECVDAYTECMKGEDACGSDFEECTTKKLFHGQMPKCLNVLAQCSPDGVEDLFGTKATSALGATTGSDDTLTYTYPTDSSAMGQWISAAAINNQYDTATCVKRYTSCLQRDSVCGEGFELCTSVRDFKKQALLCDSTLARCQKAGVIEMLGTYPWSANAAGNTIGGRVATMIEDGAQLAAMNAVSTCYKVVDQCFLGACTANPLRCVEGSTMDLISKADWTVAGESIEFTKYDKDGDGSASTTEINRYLRASCVDTIGSNKYCHMTFREQTPKDKDLSDPDLQEDVFAMAVEQRKPYVDSKIKDLMTAFDKNAKDKCIETIRSCAMRTCGGGVGSVCYASVFSDAGKNTINGPKTYADIKHGCEAIVNTDSNCIYAAASLDTDNTYSYSYINTSVFETLFPQYSEDSALTVRGAFTSKKDKVRFDTASEDPIGVVASLNSSLATNYNDAAIANMKKRCQAIATNCVKSMCGTDYVNCYRNRTDITSNITNTGQAAFDASMNKVGGVLDYTIVMGLCMNSVKNAEACSEHLKIASALSETGKDTETWGDKDSVRDAWIDAGGAKTLTETQGQVHKVDANGKYLCTTAKDTYGNVHECPCDEYHDTGLPFDKELCETPVYISVTEYKETQAVNTLFKELITDIEYEAQAKYNAKLTKQQNMCLALNNGGGVIGKNDNGSTYAWVKLRSGKVPRAYSTAGLKLNEFVTSNDLYGSFCRIRVTLQSDDPAIQEVLNQGKDWSTAYFAAGDAYTCGSWIGASELEKLAQAAGTAARAQAKYEWENDGSRNWYWALLPTMTAGALGGGYLGRGIDTGDVLGGLTGKTGVKTYRSTCVDYIELAEKNLTKDGWSNAQSYYNEAKTAADQINVKLNDWPNDYKTVSSGNVSYVNGGNTATTYKCGESEVDASEKCVGSMTVSKAKSIIDEVLGDMSMSCARHSAENTNDKKAAYTICNNAINSAIGATTSGATWDNVKGYFDSANNALKTLGENQGVWPSGLKTIVSSPQPFTNAATYTCTNGDTTTATDGCIGNVSLATAKNTIKPQLELAKKLCENATSAAGSEVEGKSYGWHALGGALTAGGLTIAAIQSARDTKLDGAELEAYNKFYEEVGQHIQCYIGGEPAGSFGDTIATSLE